MAKMTKKISRVKKSEKKRIWGLIPATNRKISIFSVKISLLSFIIGTFLAIVSLILTVVGTVVNTSSTFTSTIRLSGWNEWNDTIIYSLMKEEIVLGNDYMKQPMNKNGYVIFPNIPNDYENKTLSIHITKSQNIPFYLTDSIIEIGKGENETSIALMGLDKLCGFVRDEKGQGIFNAIVILAGRNQRTNERGYFEIDSIPIEKQRLEQEVDISQEGYKPYHNIIPMMGEKPITIILPYYK